MNKEAMKLALEALENIMLERDLDSATTIARNARYGLRQAIQAAKKQEQDTLAYREAARLAEWLFKKHYAHEEHYASGRVVWELCDTTAGVISQIDNMVCQLVKAEKQEQGEPFEYWNAVEGWVKLDEVREHFDSVSCATIYKNGGEGRVPLCLAQPKQEQGEPDDLMIAYMSGLHDGKKLAKQEQGEPVAWMHLKAYGYAPGGYMMTCRGCNNQVIDVDKRASRCRTCAEAAYIKDTTPQQRKPLTDAPLYLSNLVNALDNAFISSWQSTHHWAKQLDEARDYLAAHGIKE